MNVKEDDLVLCTVQKIEDAVVFVDVEGNGQGSLVPSEIAAGRIRNIRDYVYPNKKIVCKILRIQNNHPQLSLRRVTAKEREEVLERHKKGKILESILKVCLKDPEKVIEKIKENYDLSDFLDELKEKPEIAEKFMTKAEANSLKEKLSEKKEKEKEVKKIIILKTNSPTGLEDIKEILKISDMEIKYLGSSKFSITKKAKDFKEANNSLTRALDSIKQKAKEKKAEFEIKE